MNYAEKEGKFKDLSRIYQQLGHLQKIINVLDSEENYALAMGRVTFSTYIQCRLAPVFDMPEIFDLPIDIREALSKHYKSQQEKLKAEIEIIEEK